MEVRFSPPNLKRIGYPKNTIYMTIYSAPFTTGIDNVIVTTAQSVPIFPIMILFFVFFVILIGGSANQKRRTGSADVPQWSVLAGITTTFIALIFTLVAGIISGATLGIVVAITLMCGVWFFLSKVRGEK